jgi:hypothetical protein
MLEPQRAERLGWIIDQLTLAAIAKGQAHSPERVRINAEDLIDIPQEALALAFGKARRELDYVPMVSELRRLALADESGKLDAEMRAAWDVLVKFVGKWCRWGEDYAHAYVEQGAPALTARIVDSVRRTGGWGAYLILSYTDETRARDATFQQKRFYEEYQAWTAVERILPDLSKVLQLPESKKLLLVKPMVPVKNPDAVKQSDATSVAERIPEPLTDVELGDRREMLRQQAAALAKKTA